MIFKTIVRHMERLKRYDRLGISEQGYTDKFYFHDRKVHDLYSNLVDELIERTKEWKDDA